MLAMLLFAWDESQTVKYFAIAVSHRAIGLIPFHYFQQAIMSFLAFLTYLAFIFYRIEKMFAWDMIATCVDHSFPE